VIPTLRAVRATVLLFVLVPGLAPSAQAQGAVAGRVEAAVELGVIGGTGLGAGDVDDRRVRFYGL
jgi:hypothetical protein